MFLFRLSLQYSYASTGQFLLPHFTLNYRIVFSSLAVLIPVRL